MLYFLGEFGDQFPLLNVLRYITFRTGGAVMTALLFVFLFGPGIIRMLRLRQGTVDLPLIVDWERRPRQMVDHQNGRAAVTDWRVLRHEGDTTRVRLSPKTGRSHQLRVHMLALGHPILGDPLYAEGAARDHPRLMLHSEELKIRHPDGGAALRFRAAAEF